MDHFKSSALGTQKIMRVGVLIGMAMMALASVAHADEPSTAKPEEAPKFKVIKRTPILRGDSYDNVYSCTSDCHSSKTDYNPTKRTLTDEHDRVTDYHPYNRHEDKDDYWCQNCHQAGNYNKLTLHTGENVTFDEAYKICLQCHGNYKDEFESGIHGRKTGRWDTDEPTIFSCPTCHDPHKPTFKPMKPNPGPKPLHGTHEPAEDHK